VHVRNQVREAQDLLGIDRAGTFFLECPRLLEPVFATCALLVA